MWTSHDILTFLGPSVIKKKSKNQKKSKKSLMYLQCFSVQIRDKLDKSINYTRRQIVVQHREVVCRHLDTAREKTSGLLN